MKIPVCIIVFSCTALLLVCQGTNNPVASPWNLIADQPILAITDTTIMYTHAASSRLSCVDGSPRPEYWPAGVDTMWYGLSNDTLYFFPDSPADQTRGTTDSCAVTAWMAFLREDGGNTLAGTWVFKSMAFRIVTGVECTINDSAYNESITNWTESILRRGILKVIITDANIQFYEESKWAEDYIYDWSDSLSYGNPKSDYFDIALAKIDDTTVSLTGEKTNEVVTIRQTRERNLVYTSSVSTHTAYTYYENPVTCPNHEAPAWFHDFLDGNLKEGKTNYWKIARRFLNPANQSFKPILRVWPVMNLGR